uniref:OmpR/PhoB-type domain-containing protein n=1 Tax=Ascaris lumbricoides TaxID=6252 RepID=A0A0M3HXP5_ASCLU
MHLLKKAVEEVLTRPSSKVGGRFFGYREDGFQGDRDVSEVGLVFTEEDSSYPRRFCFCRMQATYDTALNREGATSAWTLKEVWHVISESALNTCTQYVSRVCERKVLVLRMKMGYELDGPYMSKQLD